MENTIENNSDVIVNVYRGSDQFGAVIGSPISYRYTNSTTSPNAYIERNGTTEFVFNYKIPENIEAQNSLFSRDLYDCSYNIYRWKSFKFNNTI